MIKEKIIVALDVPTKNEAKEIIAELRDEVGAFKIGLQLFTSVGASFIREVVDDGIKLFLDVKFHDIPNTVAKASVEAAKLGVWMFNIHALGGTEMMKTTVVEVREFCDKENLQQPKIIGVTILTSLDEKSLEQVGIEKNIQKQVVNLAKLSAECGLDGVVASPQEVKIIRENVAKDDFLIITPGIRLSFATNDDQKRVMTPAEAIQAGSDYLVIGRPIIKADNRINAVRQIIDEINL
ncbi:MAG: orotidine-5'-phosphate decarboxylase [Aridibacter sp.]